MSLIVYNSLGSATEVLSSLVGVDGQFQGAGSETYSAGYVGNGITPADNRGIHFGDLFNDLPNLKKSGCIQFWVKFNSNPRANDTVNWNDTAGGAVLWLLSNTTTMNISLTEFDGIVKVRCQIFPTWAVDAGNWHHWAITWQIVGADGTLKFFVDGSEVDTRTETFTGGDLEIYSGSGSKHHMFWDGRERRAMTTAVIDELKIYDNYKTNFDDRLYGRAGLNDQIIK